MKNKIGKYTICLSPYIGEGTRIHSFCNIRGGAEIGRYCHICDNCFIEDGARLGDYVTVKNGVSIWSGVWIGDNVFVGPNVTFVNDKHPVNMNQDFEPEETVICDDVVIGAGATILSGVTINKSAFIGAGAVVTKDVPSGEVWAGNPAKKIGVRRGY